VVSIGGSLAVNVQHAGAAQAHAAAEFGAGELELLANNPKQRDIRRRIYTDRTTIHFEDDSHLHSSEAYSRFTQIKLRAIYCLTRAGAPQKTWNFRKCAV
jgi:hypothetical protein